MQTKTSITKIRFPQKDTLYDLVDKNDEFIQRGTREKAKKQGLWWRVVHILVLNKRGELLICKRPPWARSYPSLITSSAGGKVEAGETYLYAAKRELEEELGIIPSLQKIGRYDVRSRKHGNVIHLLFITRADKVNLNIHEIAAAWFMPLAKVIKDTRRHPKRYTLPFLRALELFTTRKNLKNR